MNTSTSGTHSSRRFFVVATAIERIVDGGDGQKFDVFAHFDLGTTNPPTINRVELAAFPIESFILREDAQAAADLLKVGFETGIIKTLHVSAGDQTEPGVVPLDTIRVVELDVTYTWIEAR